MAQFPLEGFRYWCQHLPSVTVPVFPQSTQNIPVPYGDRMRNKTTTPILFGLALMFAVSTGYTDKIKTSYDKESFQRLPAERPKMILGCAPLSIGFSSESPVRATDRSPRANLLEVTVASFPVFGQYYQGSGEFRLSDPPFLSSLLRVELT